MPKSDIHTITFDKRYYTPESARKWLKAHNFTPIKPVHKTTNTLRYRLRDPALFKRFSTKQITPSINFVIGLY